MYNVSIIGVNGKIGSILLDYINNDSNFKYIEYNTSFLEDYDESGPNPVSENILETLDLIFLAINSDDTIKYVNTFKNYNLKIIDLSRAYRENSFSPYVNNDSEWLFGVSEAKPNYSEFKYISNPGCSSLTTILSLLPLYNKGLFDNAVVDVKFSKSALSQNSSLHDLKEDITLVKPFNHVHKEEVENFFNKNIDLFYVPSIVDIPNGISINIMINLQKDEDVYSLFEDYYKNNNEVLIKKDKSFNLNEVINTNKIGISIHQNGKQLLINTVIDNLHKGGAYNAYLNATQIFE